MPDILETMASTLAKQGAPVLGGMIGTAIGGPAGAAVGGLAGKAIEALADAFSVPATPEAVNEVVQKQAAPPIIAEVEEQARAMLPIWTMEAQRAADNDATARDKGFGAWEFWRGAWQAAIIGGWIVILLTALFGGGWVTPLVKLEDIISTWGSVTMTWLVVFNGGHTLKEVAPSIGFGRRG